MEGGWGCPGRFAGASGTPCLVVMQQYNNKGSPMGQLFFLVPGNAVWLRFLLCITKNLTFLSTGGNVPVT